MRSERPKVLHEVGGRPMLIHILESLRAAAVNPDRRPVAVAIVVGHGREEVERVVRNAPGLEGLEIQFIHQTEQKGTGHAARAAMDTEWGAERVAERASILVLPGDLPLMTEELIRQMIAPLGRTDAMRLLTCDLPDPTGYGRIVRKGKAGAVLRITEEKDASDREKAIKEVGASIYLFQAAFLRYGLGKLSNRNAQGEYYLTDLVAQASRARKRMDVLRWASSEDVRGVNTPWELALASKILYERCVKRWALEGVCFLDPMGTWLDCTVRFEGEATVYPGAILQGVTVIAKGAVIGPHVKLTNVRVGAGAEIKAGTVAEDSEIGARAKVGPYAHLRPESRVGEDAKIGNYVEIKKAQIGARSSVAHLSYVGDAEVGKNVNIGCGFVTCNYDGRKANGVSRKHRTIIEDDAFIGSDCQTIAPVRVGRGAYVASGSTVTDDVEPGALAIARARQVNKPGYAKRVLEADGN